MAKDLLRQAELHRPDEAQSFALSFLRHLQSGQHVIGTNFAYAMESNHNRRCLVRAMSAALQGFDGEAETTPSELHFLLEALCPALPKSLVLQAAATTIEHWQGTRLSADSPYALSSLSRAVQCHLLFDEWLKLVNELFHDDKNKPIAVEVSVLRQQVEDFHDRFKAIQQPPLSAMLSALSTDESAAKTVIFEKFCFDVFMSREVSAALDEIKAEQSLD